MPLIEERHVFALSLVFSEHVHVISSSSRVHYHAVLLACAHVMCHDVILFVSHVTGLVAICKFNRIRLASGQRRSLTFPSPEAHDQQR